MVALLDPGMMHDAQVVVVTMVSGAHDQLQLVCQLGPFLDKKLI